MYTLDCFNRPIACCRADHETGCHVLYQLVVQAVCRHGIRRKQPPEERGLGKVYPVEGLGGVVKMGMVHALRVAQPPILPEGTAEDDVDQLHASADAEYRDMAHCRLFDQRGLVSVELVVPWVAERIGNGVVAQGIDVGTTRNQKAVDAVKLFLDGSQV